MAEMSHFTASDFALGAATCCCIFAVLLAVIQLDPDDNSNHRGEGAAAAGTGAANAVRWIRHAKAFMLPANICVTIPSVLTYLGGGPRPPLFGMSSPIGLLLAVGAASIAGLVGLTLLLWTNAKFHRAAGTLAPWDPPARLVLSGPYRHVRNPMLTGVNLILVAEGVLLGNLSILCFSAAFVAVNTAYFIRKEEPGLRDRFGVEYDAYFRAVPRWIPRLSPYKP